MNDYSKYRPQSSDWRLPPDVKGSVDEVTYALLSEGELEGIPMGIRLQAMDDYKGVGELLEDGADPEFIVEEINRIRGPLEERYPGADLWDRVHGDMATKLAEYGFHQKAVELASTLNSPYRTVDTRVRILEAGDDNVDLRPFTKEVLEESDESRRVGLIRALRDEMISRGAPYLEEAEALDKWLVDDGIENDPINGWIDSREAAHPEHPWNTVREFMGQDHWPPEMSDFWKRYSALIYIDIIEQIGRDELASNIDEAVGVLDDFEDVFGEADAWHQIRGGLALLAFLKEQPEPAMRMTLSIRDPGFIGSTTMSLLRHGYQNEALELALANPSPEITVGLIVEGAWYDKTNEASARLYNLMADEQEPPQRRIDLMVALRDRFTKAGGLVEAARVQDMIDQVQREL